MKVVKLALLGTAALAAVSVSARADDLADLKAQIEALNARLAAVESTPAVPAGFNLLTMSKAAPIVVPGLESGDTLPLVNTIAIMPTADVPAAASVQWSGHVRAALRYVDNDLAGVGGDDDFDVISRARLNIKATNDTAVGEVGVSMDFEADYAGISKTGWGVGDYWGWWKITPAMTLGGGFTGTLAEIGAGGGSFELPGVHGTDVPGGTSQFRLSYADGPISFAIALEDGSFDVASDDAMGVAGEVKWSGDSFGFEVAGGVWGDDDSVASSAVNWQAGAGITFGMDMVSFGLGVVTGEEFDNDDYWIARASADLTLSDSISASLAVSHKDHDFTGKENKFAAGIYYSPVSQLKLGLEGDYTDAANDVVSVDLVTKYSF